MCVFFLIKHFLGVGQYTNVHFKYFWQNVYAYIYMHTVQAHILFARNTPQKSTYFHLFQCFVLFILVLFLLYNYCVKVCFVHMLSAVCWVFVIQMESLQMQLSEYPICSMLDVCHSGRELADAAVRISRLQCIRCLSFRWSACRQSCQNFLCAVC